MAAWWMPNGINGPLQGLFGSQQIPQGGVLGEPQIQQANDPKLAMAAQLLAGTHSGQGFNASFAKALMAGQQARQNAQQQIAQLREQQGMEQYRNAQMQALQQREQATPFGAIDPDQFTPESMAKFQASGNYGDLVPKAAAPSGTSDIQNWQFYQSLSPEQQKQWMALQRQPTAPQLANIGGQWGLVDRINQSFQPLSSLEQETQAVAAKAAAEGEARAVGTARGTAQGGIETKAVSAAVSNDTIDLANTLIDAATGSVAGAARDRLVGVFGYAPTGAQATAQLKILQANLMTSMPRMEGPQSDKDVQLYREAAGQIGDPTVPRETKKAAIRMIRQLNNKYIERASAPAATGGSSIEDLINKYAPAGGR